VEVAAAAPASPCHVNASSPAGGLSMDSGELSLRRATCYGLVGPLAQARRLGRYCTGVAENKDGIVEEREEKAIEQNIE